METISHFIIILLDIRDNCPNEIFFIYINEPGVRFKFHTLEKPKLKKQNMAEPASADLKDRLL